MRHLLSVFISIDNQHLIDTISSARTLMISFIGMKTVEVAIKPNITVSLHSDTEVLDEVMVVAFGTAKKSAFTGSAAVVGTEELSKRITTNVQDALVGSVPGLQMRGSSGAPGSGDGKINIRGIASMYAETDPLIIVDGAPYSASLSNIPQGDIESISVLKDAASAALYGARGAAGVIIVTTKKGGNHKATINVDAKWGSNSRAIQDYDVITNPGEYYEAVYAQFYNYFVNRGGYTPEAANKSANTNMLSSIGYNATTGAGYNVYTLPEGESLIGLNGKLNPNAVLGRRYTYNGTEYYMTPDSYTDAAYKNALRQEYNLSINGSTDKSSFYASLGYLDEEGVLQNSSYDRISARIRADYAVRSWLKVGVNAGYVHSNQDSNPNLSTSYSAGNTMYFVSRIAPIYPLYVRTIDDNGNIVIKQNSRGDNLYDYGVAANAYGASRPFSQTGNPLAANRYNVNQIEGNQLNASFNLEGNLTNFLKYNITNTVIWEQNQTHDYLTSAEGPSAGANGSLTKGSTTTMRTNFVQNLTYFKDFGRHNVNVMVGHEYYKTTAKYLTGAARGEFSPYIQEINTYATIVDATSYQTAYNVEGYFGNLQYNYDEKYYGSASYRRDASSRFAKENRWGNFWSVGGAWIVSKENFMQNTQSWLDMLKLKLSIGQQGNDNIGNFAYTDLYSISKYDDTTMVPAFNRIGNKDITWETTTNINFGIEFALWKNRLSGNIDIYTKKTTDLLFWLSVPESLGSRGYYGNIGDIRNTGIEFVLNGSLIRTRDIDWDLSLNMSHNKTKILKLPEAKIATNGGFYESSLWYEEGGEMYNYMTYAYAGVNENGEALYYYDEDLHAGGTNNISVPGKKKSGTTTLIGEASRYASGSILPKVFGGFTTSFRYKNFDFSASFDYQLGGKIYDSMYAAYMTPLTSPQAGSNYHKDWIKSWTPENPSTSIPRWQYGDLYTAAGSDRFLTSASYLNFQSFTIGYTLPKITKEISKIRIYAAGENLCFWSARQGLDPRYAYSSTESVSVYSPVRNISGGIQLTF